MSDPIAVNIHTPMTGRPTHDEFAYPVKVGWLFDEMARERLSIIWPTMKVVEYQRDSMGPYVRWSFFALPGSQAT